MWALTIRIGHSCFSFFYISNYTALVIYDAALQRTNTKLQSKRRKVFRWSLPWAIKLHVRAIIAVLGMKKVIPRAIPRGVLLQHENRPFPRTLSSGSDSTLYNRKRVAGRAVGRGRREWEKADNCYKQCF